MWNGFFTVNRFVIIFFGVLGISFMVLVLVRRRQMCRCSRNGLPARPIAHLRMVRAERCSGWDLRCLVGSWCGDSGV